jgi:hypothetical protein
MEAKYYVALKPRTNDVQRVHKEGCPFLSEDEEKIYLGRFISNHDAGKAGLKLFINAECCPFCSKQKTSLKDKPVQYKLSCISADPLIITAPVRGMFCCVN